MTGTRPRATREIGAPPARVYAIIADYERGHPAILPKPPFVSLRVDRGGVGDGTEITATMRLLGGDRSFRAVVTEPEPGRVLLETSDSGYATRFIVEPLDGGTRSRATIETDLGSGRGPVGWLERRLMRRFLPPVYARELELLEREALRDPADA